MGAHGTAGATPVTKKEFISPRKTTATVAMITRVVSKLRSDGLRGLWNSASTQFRHSRLAFQMYRAGILNHDTVYGSDYYVVRDREAALEDAEQFAQAVLNKYSPKSVIELGCGTGTLLYPYRERGIQVHGVDLSKTARETSALSDSEFEIHDLTQRYRPSQKYDLVLCVEVLEHIPEEAAGTIVTSICDAGDTAIVTAAPPGQGGTHHVNEQPNKYWIEKFEREGMEYKDQKSTEIRDELELSEIKWVQKNLLVFES